MFYEEITLSCFYVKCHQGKQKAFTLNRLWILIIRHLKLSYVLLVICAVRRIIRIHQNRYMDFHVWYCTIRNNGIPLSLMELEWFPRREEPPGSLHKVVLL